GGRVGDEKRDVEGLYTYTVLFNTARKDSPGSRPPEVGFDLLSQPRAMCFHLSGGYLFHTVRSNEIKISSESIEMAVGRFRESQALEQIGRESAADVQMAKITK